MGKKTVGIITWHYYNNFGSALQAYALQKIVQLLGYNVKIINYRNPRFGTVNLAKNRIRLILSQTLGRLGGRIGLRFSYPFLSFQELYLPQTRLYTSKKALVELGEKFNTIICGSDQIWAPNVFNDIYMGSFVSGMDMQLVSYAASVGLNQIPEDLVKKYKELLYRFKNISVREKTGKVLLEEKCGIKASVVLDPTLLLTVDDYKKIEKKPKQAINTKYVFCYFLNENHQYREKVIEYANDHGLKVIGVSQNLKDRSWMETLQAIGPQEFLWLLHHADTVFTDSYHGTIFSIIYQKSFFTFERFKSESNINQNSRIYQLAEYFGTDSFILTDTKYVQDKQTLDWTHITNSLSGLKTESMSFLREALL